MDENVDMNGQAKSPGSGEEPEGDKPNGAGDAALSRVEGAEEIEELEELEESDGEEIVDARYDDPFVRLFELYVMKAIGALSPEDEKAMKELGPELRKIYGIQGGWTKIVERVMEYPADASEEIRALWLERKQEVAQTEGRRLRPEDFAREFADKAFFADDEEDEEE